MTEGIVRIPLHNPDHRLFPPPHLPRQLDMYHKYALLQLNSDIYVPLSFQCNSSSFVICRAVILSATQLPPYHHHYHYQHLPLPPLHCFQFPRHATIYADKIKHTPHFFQDRHIPALIPPFHHVTHLALRRYMPNPNSSIRLPSSHVGVPPRPHISLLGISRRQITRFSNSPRSEISKSPILSVSAGNKLTRSPRPSQRRSRLWTCRMP